MIRMNLCQFREKFVEVLNKIGLNDEGVILTRYGRDIAKIVPLSEKDEETPVKKVIEKETLAETSVKTLAETFVETPVVEVPIETRIVEAPVVVPETPDILKKVLSPTWNPLLKS